MVDKARKHALDFSDVKDQSGINPLRVPAGDYRAKIVEVREEQVQDGDNKGKPMWNFVIQLVDRRSATYPYRCTLVNNQLWKVRNILIAAGKQVPQKRVNVDPENVVGAVIGITLDDDEYQGRDKSNISAVFPASELNDEDEEVPPPKGRAAAKKAAARREEIDELDDEAPEDDLDLDDL